MTRLAGDAQWLLVFLHLGLGWTIGCAVVVMIKILQSRYRRANFVGETPDLIFVTYCLGGVCVLVGGIGIVAMILAADAERLSLASVLALCVASIGAVWVASRPDRRGRAAGSQPQ